MGRCEKAGGTGGDYRDEENELKTWPATPVRSVVRFSSLGRYGLVGMLPVEAGAAGAGQPFNAIADWRLKIADWNLVLEAFRW
jgi:hypothetical protein